MEYRNTQISIVEKNKFNQRKIDKDNRASSLLKKHTDDNKDLFGVNLDVNRISEQKNSNQQNKTKYLLYLEKEKKLAHSKFDIILWCAIFLQLFFSTIFFFFFLFLISFPDLFYGYFSGIKIESPLLINIFILILNFAIFLFAIFFIFWKKNIFKILSLSLIFFQLFLLMFVYFLIVISIFVWIMTILFLFFGKSLTDYQILLNKLKSKNFTNSIYESYLQELNHSYDFNLKN